MKLFILKSWVWCVHCSPFACLLPGRAGRSQPDTDSLAVQTRVNKTHRPLVAFAVHCGTLCKANMAAACARALCKVGWTVLESPAARRPVTFSYPAGNVVAFGSRRAFGTGGAALRTKVLPSLRAGSGRLLGCAFLLGGGLGLYQTVKFRVQQHLAEEETKVSVHIPVSLTVSPSQGSRCQYIPGRLLDSALASASSCLLTGRVTWYLRLMSMICFFV